MDRIEHRNGIPSNRTRSKVGYSVAIRIGNLIEVAGTPSSGLGGQILHPRDMYKQAMKVIQIIKRAIEELGGCAEDIIRTRIFLTDISQWEET